MATSEHDQYIDIRDVTCGSCQATNHADRRFCGRCGQRLWEPCMDCRTPNATDQQYCGHCGVDLHAAYQRRIDDIRTRLDRCEELCGEGRYLEAAAVLGDVPATDDTRLQPLLAQVEARVKTLSEERAVGNQEAASQFAHAQALLAEREYAAALRVLERIPVGLRDRSITNALNDARDAVNEIQALSELIRKGLRTTTVEQLLSYTNRLLELCPHDATLRTLASQLQARRELQAREAARRHLDAAKKLYLAGHYAQAAQHARAITEEHVTSEQRLVFDTVQEVDGVIRWLKQEPFLHPGLVGLAERWQRLRPQDADARQMAEQLRKRLSKPVPDCQFAPAWTAARSSPNDGKRTVRWWRGLQQIAIHEDAVAFNGAPQRFLVAYGLALQGLGLAALPLNLLRPTTRSKWPKWSELRSSAPPRDVWGCDLGPSGLKALQLRRAPKSERLEIAHAVYLPHEQRWDEVADEQATTELLQDTMARFVEQHVEDSATVVLGCPGPRSLGRTFEMPLFHGKKADDAITYEAKRQIPIPADEIAFDWHAWPGEEQRSNLQSVTLLAARRNHVGQLVSACSGLPLRLFAIQSDCLALYNAAADQFFPPAPSESNDEIDDDPASVNTPTRAIVDVGAQWSSLIIAGPRIARHRSFPWGLERVDRQLMSRFHLDARQAQRLRCRPASGRWVYPLADLLHEAFDELLHDLTRTLRAYEAEGIHVDELLVAGGGSLQLGLFRRLAHEQPVLCPEAE